MKLKLLYKNLEVGSLSDIKTDMYRENGIFEILPVAQRDSSKLSEQLFEWIEIVSRLEHLESELDGEDYEENPEVNELWDRRNLLPDFEDHDCWILVDEESGKTDKISGPRFCKGGAGWYLTPTETK